MQTFLPYPDFRVALNVLDNRRLGKQRVETLQILNVLTGVRTGWRNHPAVRMWVGYEVALTHYLAASIDIWRGRGFKNSVYACERRLAMTPVMPPWLGDERLHSSHRSNLLRKHPDWYCQFGWDDDPTAPYYWPV